MTPAQDVGAQGMCGFLWAGAGCKVCGPMHDAHVICRTQGARTGALTACKRAWMGAYGAGVLQAGQAGRAGIQTSL